MRSLIPCGPRSVRAAQSVVPRKGSAILWPSVHSDDPWKTEELTYHEAVSVVAGEKFAANFWCAHPPLARARAAAAAAAGLPDVLVARDSPDGLSFTLVSFACLPCSLARRIHMFEYAPPQACASNAAVHAAADCPLAPILLTRDGSDARHAMLTSLPRSSGAHLRAARM